jgi:D-serine deaminase-like pyridoxal phosphate-dependent protein
VKDLAALFARRSQWKHLQVVGLLAYEAQIAGVPDYFSNPMKRWIVRQLKKRSKAQVLEKRAEALEWLRSHDFSSEFVNGGGSGSLAWTAADPTVSEVTVVSGFFAPRLFDHYQDLSLQPAAGFALRVSRMPQQGIWTCSGGGYPASGSAGVDRLPQPYLPERLALLELEGAGEVQTPIRFISSGMGQLSCGDLVFFRHAKAGELCERFGQLHVIDGNQCVNQVPTYRGEGQQWM